MWQRKQDGEYKNELIWGQRGDNEETGFFAESLDGLLLAY